MNIKKKTIFYVAMCKNGLSCLLKSWEKIRERV